MKFYGKTDTGKTRAENQDCFGIYQIFPGLNLCVVCDGMGGAAGGATASREAIDSFADGIRENILPDNPEDMPDTSATSLRYALTEAVRLANNSVWELSNSEGSGGKLSGMGTTLVAILAADGGYAYGVNVGDSRMYVIENGKITQISKDHSYVQDLIDMGKLTYEEARKFPMRNVITRAVGIEPEVRADLFPIDVIPDGDHRRTFLLCSDGLSGPVGDDEILRIVSLDESLEKRAEMLVDAANNAGGPDNVTAVLAEV